MRGRRQRSRGRRREARLIEDGFESPRRRRPDLCRADLRLHQRFSRRRELDREDIHGLARSLDDVMDAIDATAAIVRLYQITLVRTEARELARIIMASADQIVKALKALERRRGVAEPAVEINRLENEADRTHQIAVRRLFEE